MKLNPRLNIEENIFDLKKTYPFDVAIISNTDIHKLLCLKGPNVKFHFILLADFITTSSILIETPWGRCKVTSSVSLKEDEIRLFASKEFRRTKDILFSAHFNAEHKEVT